MKDIETSKSISVQGVDAVDENDKGICMGNSQGGSDNTSKIKL